MSLFAIRSKVSCSLALSCAPAASCIFRHRRACATRVQRLDRLIDNLDDRRLQLVEACARFRKHGDSQP